MANPDYERALATLSERVANRDFDTNMGGGWGRTDTSDMVEVLYEVFGHIEKEQMQIRFDLLVSVKRHGLEIDQRNASQLRQIKWNDGNRLVDPEAEEKWEVTRNRRFECQTRIRSI